MNNKNMRKLPVMAAILLATGFAAHAAAPQDRSGKEVVDAVCAKCHATGKDGAPKIGDQAAWSQHAAQGLDKLSDHAIGGIRKMPAHGGQAALTDLEVSRAIAYMVSGGKAVDPNKAYSAPRSMSGKQLVEARCQECHGTGKNGAPKIGDMAAWTPRLKDGVDALVKSAIHGHKAMPARAGMANLSDGDMKAAVSYMVSTSATATTPQK